MSGTTNPDEVLATVSTGSGTQQVEVTLSSSTPINGTYVPTSPAGTIGASPLVLYNWDPATQLTSLLNAQAAGTGGTIVAIGDSTTMGFGSAASGFRQLSYPNELAQALAQDGVAAQSDNFLGQGNENGADTDNRVSLTGGAQYIGLYDAGGQLVNLSAAGQGIVFTPNAPGNYNRLTLSYLDTGSGSVTIAVDGNTVGTVQFGNTGNTLTQTIAIPAGTHSTVSIVSNSANEAYIQGASFSNSTKPSVQVYNAGIGGWGSGSANTSVLNDQVLYGSGQGFGQVAGSAALKPNLALIDLGINDMTGFANNGVTVPTATIVSNMKQIIATLRAAGSDVILVIPQPFSDPSYATQLPALRAALQSLSIAENVPIIDLSATYGNSFAAIQAAGLMSDNLHPDATFYADIGSQIGALLANALTGNNTGTASTVTATTGDDTLVGPATMNTLIGDGGNDTYVLAANNQIDTIINGAARSQAAQPAGQSAASPAPAGQLDTPGLSHQQLWLAQSGNNLVVSILGTNRQAVIQNWFSGQGLAEIAASDATLLNGNVAAVLQAMNAFIAANPGFNPSTTTQTSLANGYYAGALANSVAANWDSAAGAECFCAGTLIMTPGGQVAVEDLRIGDHVVTLQAGIQRVKWIGRRSYNGQFARKNPNVLPICIKRDALADGVPARDLFVSPGHALSMEGVLVHAMRLVNGVSIVQVLDVDHVDYFHIELNEHEVVFAENCPVETYFDIGARRQFENAWEYEQLYPAAVPSCSPCQPQLAQGVMLAGIRARLDIRAGMLPSSNAGRLRGYVDEAGPELCRGWAQSAGQRDVPVYLDILVGGQRAARVVANLYRADVRDAGYGNGNHGFEVELPACLSGRIEVVRSFDRAVLPISKTAVRRAA